MFRYIHAADIHLDSPMHRLSEYENAPVEEFRQATRKAFEELIELALGKAVDFVLIAGDLYDGDWKDYNTGIHLAAQFRKLGEANIQVYIVSGNHDAESVITRSLNLPDNVKVFSAINAETHLLEELKVAIHGQSYPSPAFTQNLALSYPAPVSGYYNIGLLHTAVTGLEGHAPYAPCSMEDLKNKGYDYWALGHIHKRQTLSDDPLVIFPGNLQGRHPKETGPKGCLLVDVDDFLRTDVEFISVDVTRWEMATVDIGGVEDAQELLRLVNEGLDDLFRQHERMPLAVRLFLEGEAAIHKQLVSNPEKWKAEFRVVADEVGMGRIWLEKIKFDTRAVIAKGQLSKKGAVGELLTLVEELGQDKDARVALMEELADLDKKLPREVKSGEDALVLNEAWLESSLDRVRDLLVTSLFSEGDQQ